MTKAEFEALKANIQKKKDKANDLDVIVAQIKTLPFHHLNLVLPAEVMAIFEKYGFTE